jgi:hypothetical protein
MEVNYRLCIDTSLDSDAMYKKIILSAIANIDPRRHLAAFLHPPVLLLVYKE